MAGHGRAHLRDDHLGSDHAVLRVDDLVVERPAGRAGVKVHAVSGVSFDVVRGETLGIVGESGCGKTSTAKAVMQQPPPTSGSVRLDGQELTTLRGTALRRARTKAQIIVEDPVASLNPRRIVRDSVLEPLAIWQRGTTAERLQVVDQALADVGLDPRQAAAARPHQLSGGQCQRIAIARALVLDPQLIICDEPVSALDVSVQAQVINLLEALKTQRGLSLVFISHDLAVVKNVSDRVLVMYLGKVCEVAPADLLHGRPAHHYTRVLIDSIPPPDPDAPAVTVSFDGEPPSAVLPPNGCRFHTRCPAADARCKVEEPLMREVADGQFVACHHPLHGDDAVHDRDHGSSRE